jgi:pilus assembly protein CpaB
VSFLTPAKVTVGMLGVVGLLIGGYFVKTMLARDERPAAPARETIPMAVTDIPAGTLITAAHIANGKAQPGQLAEHADIALHRDVVVNRIAKEPIKAAVPIRSTQLYLPGEFPSLEVSHGMRAVSISVGDNTNLVSGLIKAGQYVDVHLTPKGVAEDERTGGGLTMTLLKGVKLLAVNRSQSGGGLDRNGNTVTLELTPRQSNVVLQAKDKGNLTLSYNPEAQDVAPPAPKPADDRATFNEILGLPPIPPPQPPQLTEHYRGSSRNVLQFRDGKYPDVAAALTARPGYGYGTGPGVYGNGGYQGGLDAAPGRPAPIWYHWQSYQGGSGSTSTGNGPAPSGYYPSAQTPPAPRT